MVRLFDRYIAVDWSAAARPVTGADSIWIAVQRPGGVVELSNPSTRLAAFEELLALLDSTRDRTLLVVDAPLGYPAGAADALGVSGSVGPDPIWRRIWRLLAALIVDDRTNRNNRFEVAAQLNGLTDAPGPFWGRPRTGDGDRFANLEATKPERFGVPEFRTVERALRGRGYRPASCWQLLGAGSVGGQVLTLLPLLDRLLGIVPVEVWPMGTGFVVPEVGPGGSMIAEAWPTMFEVDVEPGGVRDAAQVTAMVGALAGADDSGALAQWFVPFGPGSAGGIDDAAGEGWVLAPGVIWSATDLSQ